MRTVEHPSLTSFLVKRMMSLSLVDEPQCSMEKRVLTFRKSPGELRAKLKENRMFCSPVKTLIFVWAGNCMPSHTTFICPRNLSRTSPTRALTGYISVLVTIFARASRRLKVDPGKRSSFTGMRTVMRILLSSFRVSFSKMFARVISVIESSMSVCGNRMVVRAGWPDNGLARKGGYCPRAGNGRYSSVNT
ncbi:hypothetical protein MSKU3_3296 [Komagataeibacter oboediens]|nr:hypothetical protein MSKU3_3296 [Komagataeibacter oboediens]